VDLGFGRIFIEPSLFTPTNKIIRTYNVFGRFLFHVIHSRTAIFGEVSSALLGAQLSLALVGYEPASALVGYDLHWSLVGYELY
jgi:hypothetical protein